ncbi:MAG: hypothetical protein J1F35_05780 [Erysipelotrichales bacterium]|nr:hypothetical protein [Erysipelotrichales bacterium]
MKSLITFIKEFKNDLGSRLAQSIPVQLEIIYNDGFDNDAERDKAFNDLIKKGEDAELLDFLMSVIVGDETDGITEDDIFDNWTEFARMATEEAKALIDKE